jgi:uncharacterized protein (TIGR04222 family)
MLGLWILYGLAVLVGIATPVALLARDSLLGSRQASEALERIELDTHTLGMLSGGPGRMVDAIVTDLVERGVVLADNGSLAVSPDHAHKLSLPFDHADQDLGVLDSFALLAVRDAGHEGIWEVRRRFGETRLLFKGVFARLSKHRLLISSTRRKWEPAGLALGVLVAIWVATIGMMPSKEYPRSLEDDELQIAAAVWGWLPVTVLVAVLMSRRRGYHGRDPRSALGMACIAKLRTGLRSDATQALRVALGGFAAITDASLRKAIQGTHADSTWRLPRRREDSIGIELLAVELVDSGGADGGGGDGGGD